MDRVTVYDNRDMDAATLSAAPRTLTQLRKIWLAFTRANLGIVPMIGEDDTPRERFS